MYVSRRTFVIKRGRMEEALELFTSLEVDRPYRVYGPNVIVPGQFDEIVIESEFESLAEYEAYWTENMQSAEMDELQAKIFELTDIGGRNELLALLHVSE